MLSGIYQKKSERTFGTRTQYIHIFFNQRFYRNSLKLVDKKYGPGPHKNYEH